MLGDSSFFNQVNPITIQLELKRLKELAQIDQIAFLELTALSSTRFNPGAAQNILRAYLAAGSRYHLSENKTNKYFILQERIYRDLIDNYGIVCSAWNTNSLELDPHEHPPIVVADNLTQYILRETAFNPSEVEAVLRKLSSQQAS